MNRTEDKNRSAVRHLFVYPVLLAYLVIVVYPMAWLLYTSLKTDREIFLAPFTLPDWANLQWINFSRAWTVGQFGDYFLNSAVLTVLTVILSLLFAAMAAYALSRFRFAGARPLFYFFLAGLMVPLQLAIVPLFFQMKDLMLLNSRLGLLLVYIAFGMPFAIFILAGFFKSLPSGLHESALMDGAGELRAFWHIMLPLAKPALVTVGIFAFLGTWNGLHVPVGRKRRAPAHASPRTGQHHHCEPVPKRLGHGLRRPGTHDAAHDGGLRPAPASVDQGHYGRRPQGVISESQ